MTHANLFSRFTRVISSYANSLITAAEDPEKILDQTVNEMQGGFDQDRQATGAGYGEPKAVGDQVCGGE